MTCITSTKIFTPHISSVQEIEEHKAAVLTTDPSSHNEIPVRHELTFEWNEQHLQETSRQILIQLKNWDGQRPQEFILLFTKDSQQTLVDIVSVTYSITNDGFKIDYTQCIEALRSALTNKEIYQALKEAESRRIIPLVAKFNFTQKPVKIYQLIAQKAFKNFENPLDNPAYPLYFDLSSKKITDSIEEMDALLEKGFSYQKRHLTAVKIRFTMEKGSKIIWRTSRIQNCWQLHLKHLPSFEIEKLVLKKAEAIAQAKKLDLLEHLMTVN